MHRLGHQEEEEYRLFHYQLLHHQLLHRQLLQIPATDQEMLRHIPNRWLLTPAEKDLDKYVIRMVTTINNTLSGW